MMLILLSFYREHHSSLILVLLLINLVLIIDIAVLSHEKTAATSLRAYIPLVLRTIVVRWFSGLLFLPMPGRALLNAEGSIADGLVRGVEDVFGTAIPNSQARARLHLENFLPHEPVLLSEDLDLIIMIYHFFELRIFFFQN